MTYLIPPSVLNSQRHPRRPTRHGRFASFRIHPVPTRFDGARAVPRSVASPVN